MQGESIKRRYSLYRQIIDGMFLLYSPKFLKLERGLQYYSFIKNFFGEKVYTPNNYECATGLEGIFDARLQQL